MSADPGSETLRIPSGITNWEYALLWFLGFQRHVLGTPQFAPLKPLFRADPERMTEIEYVQNLHYTAMCRIARTLNPDLARLATIAVDSYVRGRLRVPAVGEAPDETEAEATAAELGQVGHVTLPPIEAGKVTEMRDYLAEQPVRPGAYVPVGPTMSADDARGDANIANIPADRVVSCPHLAEIAGDPQILSVVARHLGTVPMILGYTAWWSFAGQAEAQDAQLFHMDVADYAFCKLFIHLTDVDRTSGPHAFMRGTHDPQQIKERRAAWPDGTKAFDDWFFMTLRKTDEDVVRYLGGEPDYITGPAGTCFLADTRGIHKGLLPESRDRLVCQVVYGVSPYMQPALMSEKAFPISRSDTLPQVPAHLTDTPPGDYIQRLFLVS